MEKLNYILRDLLLNFASSRLCTYDNRNKIYRLFGASIGEGTLIESGLDFLNPSKLSNLSIGNNCFINSKCLIDTSAKVTIEDNVAIAPRVTIITTTHNISLGDSDKRVKGKPVYLPVTIDKGCWICYGSTLLAGCRVGQGTILGANTLVFELQTLEKNRLYCGSPAVSKKLLHIIN